jgi:glycosyltransferase involved in cell wall biosynthesis
MNGFNMQKWFLEETEYIWTRSERHPHPLGAVPLVALLRVRNEALILEDTLNHLAGFADVICAYDDASTDATLKILKAHEKVFLVVQNMEWQAGVESRLLSETRHRGLLLQEARRRLAFDWCMCCDADERYVGPIRQFVADAALDKPDAIRIQLFDAYMTDGDDHPYPGSTSLTNFRRLFGPERRDILMLWKNSDSVHYTGLDAREPVVQGRAESRFFCQHYGKSLSYAHWEATCDYYVNHFPFESYGKKWSERRGKALHSRSDFDSPLFEWGDDLFENAVRIY